MRITSPCYVIGTGIRGMITKGDLLAFLGKASTPSGTFRDDTPTPSVYKTQAVTSNKASAPEKVCGSLCVSIVDGIDGALDSFRCCWYTSHYIKRVPGRFPSGPYGTTTK